MTKPFAFSELQANHILDLTLGRLTKLGKDELVVEEKQLKATIKDLNRILKSKPALFEVMREELGAVASLAGRKRRTEIVTDDSGDISSDELVDKSRWLSP